MKSDGIGAGATVIVSLLALSLPALAAPPAPTNLRALSRHLRVDLTWDQEGPALHAVEIRRSQYPGGPFRTISADLPKIPLYSDFIGAPQRTFYYRVRAVDRTGEVTQRSPWSDVAKGVFRRSTRNQLLTEVQEAGFRYFYDYGHPVSGLAREGSHRAPDLCTIGATGMGLFNLGVGVERRFITRQQGAARALKMLRFLSGEAVRYHGAFPHWINGATGETIRFGQKDDGADLVETAFLAQGMLFLREFFLRADPDETEIRRLADRLWREIEWDWFAKQEDSRSFLLWHWSPNYGWEKHLPISGFNECQIVYILALASPTHGVPMEYYETGWYHARYAQERTEFGVPLTLHRGYGPPLFFTHYSYLGFDPRKLSFRGKTYFQHFQDLCRVQVLYARSKEDEFRGYGPLWGLTASMDPDGYKAHAPGPRDNGTITPTAALASMPYVPAESIACLTAMYEQHGGELWREFGFRDAFNLSKDWIANGDLGIDVGPIAPLIENHRTGLCWRVFMKAPEVRSVLERLADGPS